MDNKYNYPSGQIVIPPFINKEGIFNVILIDKMWGNKSNLVCVFETGTGDVFSAITWRKKSGIDLNQEIYSPKISDIDFKYISRGTRWQCRFKLSGNGQYYNWIEAISILD